MGVSLGIASKEDISYYVTNGGILHCILPDFMHVSSQALGKIK
jgi:hypothetical protein